MYTKLHHKNDTAGYQSLPHGSYGATMLYVSPVTVTPGRVLQCRNASHSHLALQSHQGCCSPPLLLALRPVTTATNYTRHHSHHGASDDGVEVTLDGIHHSGSEGSSCNHGNRGE